MAAGVHELDCTSDDDAKQQAAKFVDGQDLEVAPSRRVAILKHHTRH